MTNDSTARFRRLAAQYIIGAAALALLTFVCFRLGFDLATTAFVYLIVITLVSLMGSFIGSAILSIVTVACLTYFFAPPIFSLRIDSAQQVLVVISFLLTSLVVTRLVERTRMQAKAALEAGAALRRNEAYLEEAQRLSHTGSFTGNRSTGEQYWSEETFRIFQYDRTTKPTMDLVYQRIHPEDVPLVRQALEHAAQQGKDYSFEHRLLMPDGRIKHVQVFSRAWQSSTGNPEFVGAIMDTTERKQVEADKERLEAQLRQSQKLEAMGTLAGGIAHDFNNILGAILGYGELAQEAAPESKDVRRYVDNVMQAGGRAKSLVERILAFSRSGVGERSPINVQAVIEETLELLAASLTSAVSLEKRLEAGNAAVVGDATQLYQVVMNLCTNAWQAMENGGVLGVALDRADVARSRRLSHGDLAPGNYVRLCVSDTGSGIPPHVLDRMFDPFFTTKNAGEGTGLGLSLVHGSVADLGGAIDVRTTMGRGTAFTIWLPIAGEAAAPALRIAAELPHGQGQSIMIVDDEKSLVALGEEILAALGYEPIGFNSGVAALEAFRDAPQRFDIVLTDEAMPKLNGTDLAREIRLLRPDIPIVLMSGYASAPLLEHARAVGIREVLRKPLHRKDIADCFGRLLH